MCLSVLQYKRELICKASGVQFIPAMKLREIYPHAAAATAEEQRRQSETQTDEQCARDDDTDAAQLDDAGIRGGHRVEGTEADVDGTGGELGGQDSGELGGVSVRRGTEVSLLQLRLCGGAETLLARRLNVLVACSRCRSVDELQLSNGRLYTVQCARCHVRMLIEFNAVIAHQLSAVIGFINVDQCQPVDVVLTTSQFHVGCTTCNTDAFINVRITSNHN